MQTEAPLAEKVYRLPRYVNIYFLILPVLSIIVIGFGLLTFLPSLNASFLDSIETTCVGIIFFGLMVGMYKAVKEAHLILTDDGITFYAWGYRIYTPWQNVIRMTRKNFSSRFPASLRKFRVLQLRQPCVLGMKVVEGKQKGVAVLEIDWWSLASIVSRYVGVVPLSPMLHGRNWKESALFRDIQEHAPWIVIDEGVQ